MVNKIAGEIYNEGTIFRQTDVVERCRTCPYKEICRR